MTEIIGVRFKKSGKIYHFAPAGVKFKKGDKVIVKTSFGKECGEVVIENINMDDSKIIKPLKKILRKANKEDLIAIEKLENENKYAENICKRLVQKYRLDMKVLDAQYTLDKNKLLINFSSEDRIDFRKLVRELATKLNARIELKQLGARDETKLLGGIASCGREYCCKSFLSDFHPVSIKMAKEQGLSLNPVKVSGVCGRLMCCLKYEQNAYTYLTKTMPKIGDYVSTESGNGYVKDINLISGNIKVKLEDKEESSPCLNTNVKEIKVLNKRRK